MNIGQRPAPTPIPDPSPLEGEGRSLALALALLLAPAAANATDLTRAAILARPADPAERAAVQVLARDLHERAKLDWPVRQQAPAAGPLVVIGRCGEIARLLPGAPPLACAALKPEGYALRSFTRDGREVVAIGGADDRGVLYGVGRLLRSFDVAPGSVRLARRLDLATSPGQAVRGTQFGYRFKNNTYDAWTVDRFDRRIRDLALFGLNTVQVIAPDSDDEASSPLFPAPPLATLQGIGRATHRYGLDFALYYPEMAKDYAAPGAVEAELKRFTALIDALPKIDALYIPGGDPGHTAPDLLFPLVEKEAAVLRARNPSAKVWVSGQGFDAARYERFYALLAREPAWLSGVFFGPQSRDPMPVQRARIPARYPLLFYPDIGHTLHAQFPVPRWSPYFALTEGREPVDPRPQATTAIFRHFAPFNAGFVTYSEGVNDDVNQALWLGLGWSKDADPRATLEDYARAFVGGDAGAFAYGLFALERNWIGDPASHPAIDRTLQGFDRLERLAPEATRRNWRLESALYRATYDSYVRRREAAETARESRALAILAQARTLGSGEAVRRARAALDGADDAAARALRARLFDLAGRLYRDIGLQLSVKLYGASGVERGANLDRVDVSLNDRLWLERQFEALSALPDERARVERLLALSDPADRREGALHDDLGDPANEPHLVRGEGWARDPELYHTAIDGVADRTPDDGWRMSQISYAETLYETPLTLRYAGLDLRARYRLRVVLAGEDYALPMRLVANGRVTLWGPAVRASNPAVVEIDIPRAQTRSGRLRLDWTGPASAGGSGRGHQVAEVWLIPDRGGRAEAH